MEEDTSELAEFRQQWREELLQRNVTSRSMSREEKATELFLKGVACERRGTHYEALHFYRQAIQLVPDIESRLSGKQHLLSDTGLQNGSEAQTLGDDEDEASLWSDQTLVAPSQSLLTDGGIGELTANVSSLSLQKKFVRCRPMRQQKMVHVSALPEEILIYIFRWVVSCDLHMRSLEVVSMVCRSFYSCARDPELWRLACIKTWGPAAAIEMNSGVSWRQFYISQPHLLFDGVYISQTSYVRAGEPSLDEFYRPFHTVEYFRYLRFYADGQVVYLNTPDAPINCVHRLRNKASAVSLGVQTGHYTLTGDKLSVEVKQPQQSSESMSRYRHRGQQIQQNVRNFHLDLQVRNVGCRRCAKLVWQFYSCHTTDRTSGQVVVTDFPLNQVKPFFFSRVKSFTSHTSGILH